VLTGDLTSEGQGLAGTPAGYQVLYTRGINTFDQMMKYWSYMGFIVNQNVGPHGALFPYFTEQERSHEKFTAAAIAVGDASNVGTGLDGNFSNAWFVTPDSAKSTSMPLQARLVQKVSKAPMVTFNTSRRHGRIPNPS
jgi:L-lysine 6-oxidase